MVSTFSPNFHLELQGTGDNSGTWGSELNSFVFSILDQALGGAQTLSLSSIPVAVSTSQSQHAIFLLTGVLTADVTVTFPAIGRMIYVVNQTTGNFKVTLAAGTPGTTQIIPQGASGLVILNVNDVLLPTLPETGAITDIAGAATIDLGTIASRNANITGSGWTATSFGSSAIAALPIYFLRFNATGTLTHNATSLILPGGANISVQAGDMAIAMYLGSGNWRVVQYTRAAASLGVGYLYASTQVFVAGGTYTPTPGTRYIRVRLWGGGAGGGGVNSNAFHTGAAGGGGEGAYTEYNGVVSAAQTVTIGAGGTAGNTAGSNGGNGGQTSLGALATAPGGSGGNGSVAGSLQIHTASGGNGGAPGTGTVAFAGAPGGNGIGINDGGSTHGAIGGIGGGQGGGLGGAIDSGTASSGDAGGAGRNYGGGGGGGAGQGGTDVAGGAGKSGILIIDEYV